MDRVVVFGTGQMADLAHVYFGFDSPLCVAAFCVDAASRDRDTHRGLPVVDFETVQEAYPPDEFFFFAPLSAKKVNTLRAEKFAQAKAKGYRLASYVSSRAMVCPETRIGENCFVFENNVIQPFAEIGDNVVLWSGNHIGHHSRIGDHCFVASHVVVSGRVTVGPYCYLGVNATIRDGVHVHERCVVGAGALLLKSTKQPGQVFLEQPTKAFPFSSDSVDLV